ncbi:regulator of microtubule dynamics protein 3 isoform X2 [Ambystoma mexicanum]
MSKLGTFSYRAGIGLVLGTATGIVVYGLYKQQWRKRIRRKNYDDDDEHLCNLHSTPVRLSCKDIPLQQTQVSHERHVQMEAGDAVLISSVPGPGDDVEVLDRLDFVLRSIAELRQEVAELRCCLQGLAVEIVGQLKSHITESQKATRRRRYLFHRERSDSTGSSSVYFTATSGTVCTDGESEGGYTTANPESDYDRESGRESEEDEASCETVKTVRRDSMDLVNEEETTLTFDSLEDDELLQQRAEQKHDEDAEQSKTDEYQLLLLNK